ncbi:MAG: flagellar motor switch protein FliM [Ignavibacteriaceae bacterium]
MAEVLSQQEIDQLLNKVKSGDEQPAGPTIQEEASLYDFRLPNRISKNQLRTLRNIHDNFAESFSSFLVTKLQSIVSINVTSIDQIYYSEYVLSVSNPGCLYTFELKDTDIKGILELNLDLALSLVDRMLGGNGLGSKQVKIITPIEQKVLFPIIEKIMYDLKKVWQVVDNYDFRIERFESDIDFAQITSQNESVLLISFEILVGEQSFLMNVCFATFAFDTVLSKLSSQKLSTIRPTKYNGITARDLIKSHLDKTFLPVTVEFGSTKITVDELLNLTKGDILKLSNKISDDHLVKVGNKKMFYGKIGVVNKNKAIKINKRILANNKDE